MIALKEFLDISFRRTFFLLSSLFAFLLVVIIVAISYINSKDQIQKNLHTSSAVVTDLLYSQNISEIADYFNSLGMSDLISKSEVFEKPSGRKVFESDFGTSPIIPSVCGINNASELVSIKICVPLILKITIQISIILLVGMVFAVFCLYLRLRAKSYVLFKNIGEELLDLESNRLSLRIFEIEEVKKAFNTKNQEIIQYKTASAFSELSRQVAHDIRSPLATLQNLSLAKSNNATSDSVMMASLKRLSDIADSLLLSTNLRLTAYPNYSRFNILDSLNSIKDSKFAEYLSKDLSFELKVSEDLFLWFNKVSFERIISNCINNSIEAINGKIEITIEAYLDNGNTHLRILDNGPGFSNYFLETISCNKRIVSQKKTGNGLALNFSQELISKAGGKILFYNHKNGAAVELIFSSKNYSVISDEIVLIDDDKYIRKSWEILANQKSISLYTFATFEEFAANSLNFSPRVEIFLDSELGEEVKGECLIEELVRLGFDRINIETGKVPADFPAIERLNSIKPKSFPY